MRDFMMAAGGGFFGVLIALGIAFGFVRQYIRAKLDEMTQKAHQTGICPICNQKMKHDRFIGDVE
jgi:hypothetical protein